MRKHFSLFFFSFLEKQILDIPLQLTKQRGKKHKENPQTPDKSQAAA